MTNVFPHHHDESIYFVDWVVCMVCEHMTTGKGYEPKYCAFCGVKF